MQGGKNLCPRTCSFCFAAASSALTRAFVAAAVRLPATDAADRVDAMLVLAEAACLGGGGAIEHCTEEVNDDEAT